MTELAQNFLSALRSYLSDPNNRDYQQDLLWAGYYIHDEFFTKQELISADNYIPKIEEVLQECHLDTLSISKEKSAKMLDFIRRISDSEDAKLHQAFHAINMAYTFWLNSRFISSYEDEIRSQAVKIENLVIASILTQRNTRSYQALQTISTQLNQKIDNYFSQEPEKQKIEYQQFSREIKRICKENAPIINKEISTKTIIHNLWMAVIGLGIFYGIYLLATAHRRQSFFLQPDSLSSLRTASIEIKQLRKNINSFNTEEPLEMEESSDQSNLKSTI